MQYIMSYMLPHYNCYYFIAPPDHSKWLEGYFVISNRVNYIIVTCVTIIYKI